MCRRGRLYRCSKGHKQAHLAGVHQQRLAGVVSCRAWDQARCIWVAPSSRRRQQRRWVLQGSSSRQPQRSAPASLAFLMSPRLMPSASSFSTGCRQGVAVGVAVARGGSRGAQIAVAAGAAAAAATEAARSRERQELLSLPIVKCTTRRPL